MQAPPQSGRKLDAKPWCPSHGRKGQSARASVDRSSTVGDVFAGDCEQASLHWEAPKASFECPSWLEQPVFEPARRGACSSHQRRRQQGLRKVLCGGFLTKKPFSGHP